MRGIGGGDLIADAFNYLKKLGYAILATFASTYAFETLFLEMNNIKDFLRNPLADDSNSTCILLKVTSYDPDIGYMSSNLQQQKFRSVTLTFTSMQCKMYFFVVNKEF
ncbi:dimer_Tnp_hAT domain-containing protein [Trichonephila clavipes]|uniref:Dimer_Tnp_hAT domain-containing protein n=1 Tax=Trichonephila clavipes TaxID=2585209 RepID=A0A8X6SKC9_TRICX|nr:dimer_Tnp_hAT domain-containing protein [Trichonephila clavipes]